jgi:membrane fusion protein, copper/silver efflux system
MRCLNFYIGYLLLVFIVLGCISCNGKKNNGRAGHVQQQQEVNKVQLEDLLKPVNGFVISTIQVTSIEHREEEIELNVVGTVAYDTRNARSISSKINGRIEKLYIRYKYQPVQKGQRIMEIYSPELMTAEENLLFLLRNDSTDTLIIDAAKDRLRLMGMSADQVAALMSTKKPIYSVPVYSSVNGFITDINKSANSAPADNMRQVTTNMDFGIREGTYVQSGQAVFTVYDPSKAWILIDIYPEQQTLVAVGNPVKIVPETAPSEPFVKSIDYIEPIFKEGKKTGVARVYFNNETHGLPIGSRVTAVIYAKSKAAWWLPKEATLSIGRERIVFKKEEAGFKATKIAAGIEVDGKVQILGGLEKEDSVAVNAGYLVDNEAFINANTND